MKRTKAEIMEDLGEYERKHSKAVANNTIEYWNEKGDRIIRLHDTDIVTLTHDGKIILNSDGWETVTTKNRINDYIRDYGHVYQRQYVWYVELYPSLQEKVFYDGMVIDLNVRR